MGDAEMLKQYLLLTPEHKCMIRHFVKLARIYQQMMRPDNGEGKSDSNKT
jgi:hypothetical protein